MKITLDLRFDSATRGRVANGLTIALEDIQATKVVKLMLYKPQRYVTVDCDELIQALKALRARGDSPPALPCDESDLHQAGAAEGLVSGGDGEVGR